MYMDNGFMKILTVCLVTFVLLQNFYILLKNNDDPVDSIVSIIYIALCLLSAKWLYYL